MANRFSGTSTLQLEKARNALATIWFVGAGVIFIILMVQSILGKYSGQLQEVWSWFVPTVVLEPFSDTPGIQLLILSNYWLSPIQGLVVAAIGVLFAAQEKATS